MNKRIVIVMEGGNVSDVMTNITDETVEVFIKDLDDDVTYRVFDSLSANEVNEIANSIEY